MNAGNILYVTGEETIFLIVVWALLAPAPGNYEIPEIK